ncbi:hypothetical protein C0J52_20959 [Blattella germanica]|nr:hypothetical protein C0J52_20959 [Blattella germanica]
MIKRVEKCVLEDSRMFVEHIASRVGIYMGTVHTILHQYLKMRKLSHEGTKNADGCSKNALWTLP